MAITVKFISEVIEEPYRTVFFEGYQDGELVLENASLRVPASWPAETVGRKVYANAVQRIEAQAPTVEDISALLGQELGEQDVNPLASLSLPDLRLYRKRELQAALNAYLAKQADGTDRYTPYMFLAMSRAKDALDAAVAGGATLSAEQQAILDRLNLCDSQFIGPVNAHYGYQAAIIDAATQEELLAMGGWGFEQFDADDPDITLNELGG